MTGSNILRPGFTCWSISEASRLAFLIDGASYFAVVAAAMEKARHRICIVGWDFDSNIRLRPFRDDDPPLGQFLRELVERTPSLHVDLLIWRGSILYGRNTEMTQMLFGDWRDHPRIDFRYDGTAPMGASQHEKIVLIDDSLAFIGGMDLTQERWDDRRHVAEGSARLHDGQSYMPVHDVQAMIEGKAAAAVAECVSRRWQLASGKTPESLRLSYDLWPTDVPPVMEKQPVAIARTRPERGTQAGVNEIEPLTLAAIRAARRIIYIEAQYFALPSVAEALAMRLEQADGPEIVLVVMQRAQGMLERYAMAQERDRLFARLCRTTHRQRLGLFYPVAARDPVCEISLHSKLMIVDDRFLRVGSANLNRRSMGVDSECDMALEAQDHASRGAVEALCHDLLVEHLDTDMATWRRLLAGTGSYLAAIARLNQRARGFATYEVDAKNPPASMPGIGLADPDKPLLPTLDTITESFAGLGDGAPAKTD